MKNLKVLYLLGLVSLFSFYSGSALAAERIQYWAKDADSEYAAVKAAYKQILGQALKLQIGSTSGASDGALKHKINRSIEEDFVSTKQYFIQSSVEDCDRKGQTVNCLVVAGVKMDEVASWLRSNMGDSGKDGNRLENVKFGIMANKGNEHSQPYIDKLVKSLHKNLGLKFGNDVYKVTPYIDPTKLRNQCVALKAEYDKKSKMGSGYKTSTKRLKSDYEHCITIVEADLDAILVIKDLVVDINAYDGSKVEGMFEPKLLFIQTRTKRELFAPDDKRIVKSVYGSKMSAESDFDEQIYQATINYITQQFNDIVITSISDENGNKMATEQSKFDYTVTISGVNADDLTGKKKLRFIRQWFKDKLGVDFKRDAQRSSHSEKVNIITSKEPLELYLVEEDLPLDLDKEGYLARIDITKGGNIIIAFRGEEAAGSAKTVVGLNHKDLIKWLKINKVYMSLRREDATGTPIALNEATVSVSNNSRKNVLVEVKPTWTDAGGLQQTIPFSDDKQFLIKAKSSVSLVYRAPNRQADHVSLAFTCLAKRCDVK